MRNLHLVKGKNLVLVSYQVFPSFVRSYIQGDLLYVLLYVAKGYLSTYVNWN